MIQSDFTVQRFFVALSDQTKNNKNVLSIGKLQDLFNFFANFFFALHGDKVATKKIT